MLFSRRGRGGGLCKLPGIGERRAFYVALESGGLIVEVPREELPGGTGSEMLEVEVGGGGE